MGIRHFYQKHKDLQGGITMLIRNKKRFSLGVILAISFLLLLLVIMSPVFGGRNGLRYADDIFNKLSKGSSYFIPEATKSIEKFMDKQISVTIKYENPEDAQRTAQLLTLSEARTEQQEGTLKIEGSLGKIMATGIRDSNFMYYNDGEKLKSAYGYDEKQVMKDWWQAFDKMSKEFKKTKVFDNAKILSDVNKKVVEAAYNFYQIEPVKVSERAGTMTGLLVFYVLYSLWWGFALMFLVEGMGLTMTKKGAKKED
jgi:hypothetical protein